jgi:hypothetical protein
VALAVLLSVSAGLLLRSFVRVTAVESRRAHRQYPDHEPVSLPEVKYDTPRKRATSTRI